MNADEVAAASLRGLEQGRIYVIPGVRYRVLAALARLAPAGLRRSATRLYARRTKRV
jgi:short-subunit dehydrogenase